MVGDAQQHEKAIRIAGAQEFQRGAIWYCLKQYLADGFATSFQFRFSGQSRQGADGIVFVIQNDNAGAIGASGGNMGYGYTEGWEKTHENENSAIQNCIAIEIDTYYNGEYGDFKDNHISVHTNGAEANSQTREFSIASTTKIPNLSDNNIHTCKIVYIPGKMDIFLDDILDPVLSVSIDIPETIDLDSGQAWLGFTSATGGDYQNNDLISWKIVALGTMPGKPYLIVDSESPCILPHLGFKLSSLGGYDSGHIPVLFLSPKTGLGLFDFLELAGTVRMASFLEQEDNRICGFDVILKLQLFKWRQDFALFLYAKYAHTLDDPVIVEYQGELTEVGRVVSPHADLGGDIVGGLTGQVSISFFSILLDINYARTELRDYHDIFLNEAYKNRLFGNIMPAIYFNIAGTQSLMVGIQNRVTYWFDRGYMYDIMPQVSWMPLPGCTISVAGGFPIVGGNVYKFYADITVDIPFREYQQSQWRSAISRSRDDR